MKMRIFLPKCKIVFRSFRSQKDKRHYENEPSLMCLWRTRDSRVRLPLILPSISRVNPNKSDKTTAAPRSYSITSRYIKHGHCRSAQLPYSGAVSVLMYHHIVIHNEFSRNQWYVHCSTIHVLNSHYFTMMTYTVDLGWQTSHILSVFERASGFWKLVLGFVSFVV